MFHSNRQKIASMFVFGLYLFLLIWLVLFKFSTDLTALSRFRSVNLIPFQESLIINETLSLEEIFLNMLIFIPFGVYISILKYEWSFAKKAVSCLLLSLTFETLQFIFAIGASDITDLIGNTSGGVIGIWSCSLLQNILPKQVISAINICGFLIELFAFIMLILLFTANR